MAQAAITCGGCGAQQMLRGTAWELEAAITVWRNGHERAAHQGEKVPGWNIGSGTEPQQLRQLGTMGAPRQRPLPIHVTAVQLADTVATTDDTCGSGLPLIHSPGDPRLPGRRDRAGIASEADDRRGSCGGC